MSTKTAALINNLIVNNPQSFAINSTMTAADWRQLVSSIFTLPRSVRVQSNQFAYINSYAAFNRVLRKRGLKIKASDYYKTYTVIGLDDAKREVTAMINKGTAIINAANELKSNIPNTSRKYRFRSLRAAEIVSVGRYVTTPLTFR